MKSLFRRTRYSQAVRPVDASGVPFRATPPAGVVRLPVVRSYESLLSYGRTGRAARAVLGAHGVGI
ncbi:hypothetical protein ACFH04_36420 [Streptomyces noboritoensis]|uniref:Uncharacterized protein n=1 Tax=Streptomyces noboritoensis TaxID=67337 RepID=A0ABV6TTP7_9ACTN